MGKIKNLKCVTGESANERTAYDKNEYGYKDYRYDKKFGYVTAQTGFLYFTHLTVKLRFFRYTEKLLLKNQLITLLE